MQNKGIIKVFAILFGLVCIYQLSFTFITNKVENEAEEQVQLTLSHISRKRFCHAQRHFPDYRGSKISALFLTEIPVKTPYHQQVFVDGFRGQVFLQHMIKITFHICRSSRFNGNRQPGQEELEPVKIVFYGVSGVVSSLQIPSVVQD